MIAKLKKYLTAKPRETRIVHYAEVFGATAGLAAIASAEHVANLHEPISWSVVFGVAAAGGKAAVDLAKPLVVGFFTKILTAPTSTTKP